MAKKYYWLKLMNDFFQQPKIKKLRKIAGGDTYTVIYLKMQLLSLQTDGKLYFDEVEDTFANELALKIDEDEDNVLFVLMYLQQQGLIVQMDECEYALPETMRNIGNETESAQRVRKFRERQKTAQRLVNQEVEALPGDAKALQCNADVTTCNTSVRECNTEIEKEIEIEIEIDTPTVSNDTVCPTSVGRIAEKWNELGVSQVQGIKPGTKRYDMLKRRIKEYGVEAILTAIERIKQSSFLLGDNKNGWCITFDWFIRPNNYPKVAEGNYDNGQSQARRNEHGKRVEQSDEQQVLANVGSWY